MTDHPTAAGHNDRCLIPDCAEQWPDLPAAVHDALLDLEDDMSAVTHALLACESTSELGVDGEHFERFAVSHRWRDPVAVYNFARLAHQLMELRHTRPAAPSKLPTVASPAEPRVVDELRVRRLVVVAEDGFERVVLEDAGSHGGVTVNSREAGKYGSVYAAMSATEEARGGDASVYVSAGGGICTGLTVDLVDESRSLFSGSVFVDDSEGDGGMSFDRYGVRMEAGRVEAERRRVNEKPLL
jgi:hypothetical protein